MIMRSIVLSAAILAAPLAAQQAADAPTTAAQDLDCALWASYTLGTLGDNADADVVAGLSMAIGWFSGLYEGKTGASINTAMETRSEIATEADIERVQDECLARLGRFSERLDSFGE